MPRTIVWPTVADHPRQLERVDWRPSRDNPPDLAGWPYTIPAVAQLIEAGGLELPPGITFLIGENGSGKSTLVEAFAAIYPRRGFETPYADKLGPGASAEDSPLRWHLRARTHRRASPAGFFLRAEAMHGYLARIDSHPHQARTWGDEQLSTQSHGESFLAVLRHRFGEVGVYFMDEPEAALSSAPASRSWRSSTRCAPKAARWSSRPIRRSSSRSPAPPCWSWGSGVSGRRRPTSSTWCRLGGRSWASQTPICATCWGSSATGG
jgi:predicted ATPase